MSQSAVTSKFCHFEPCLVQFPVNGYCSGPYNEAKAK
jgi:hypothetical protein